MRCMRASVILFTVVLATGCASSYQVVRMPQREADLYPYAQTQAGITIAVDEISDASRAARYFGADLVRAGILPLAVVVSNYGEHRVVVKPSDVLLHRGKEIIDPLPVEAVTAVAKDQRWFLRSKTQAQIDSFFAAVVFTETALFPNESYQGVIFFSIPKEETQTKDALFKVLSLYREGGPKIRVGVTDLETHDRVHFGPFSLSLPQDTL